MDFIIVNFLDYLCRYGIREIVMLEDYKYYSFDEDRDAIPVIFMINRYVNIYLCLQLNDIEIVREVVSDKEIRGYLLDVSDRVSAFMCSLNKKIFFKLAKKCNIDSSDMSKCWKAIKKYQEKMEGNYEEDIWNKKDIEFLIELMLEGENCEQRDKSN